MENSRPYKNKIPDTLNKPDNTMITTPHKFPLQELYKKHNNVTQSNMSDYEQYNIHFRTQNTIST